MHRPLLLRGARQLVTLRGAEGPRRGAACLDLGIINDGSILIRDGRIVSVGHSRRIDNLAEARYANVYEAHGVVVMPGLVDAQAMIPENNGILRRLLELALWHGTTTLAGIGSYSVLRGVEEENRGRLAVIPNLEKTFPNCQFIVTTHSPQVLADVGPGAVVVLEPDADGNVVAKRAKSPLGHDSNYILEVLMGVSERPQALAEELERLFALIDDNDLAEAKKLRASIIEKWNADIPALTKAEVAIQRKERFAK